MHDMRNNPKKKLILVGVMILLGMIIWITISIVNVVNQAAFRLAEVHTVRNDIPLLMVCFTQKVKADSSTLVSKDFTVKSQPASMDTCAAFQLSTDDGDISAGSYYMQISVESQSGKKITGEEIVVKVVDGGSDKDSQTLSDEELNKLVQANNDVDINKTIAYWKKQPIYKFVDPTLLTYDGVMWSIALRADADEKPMIVVYLNSSKPPDDKSYLNRAIESDKKSALDKIREWGVNPDDYKIEYKFKY